jgi:predicted MPP superfamily phosphohydrolase
LNILQLSDTHLGIIPLRQIELQLKKAVKEDKSIDMIVHCGDYCGGIKGYKSVRTTVALIRKYFPQTTYLSVIGNHDYWSKNTNRSIPTLRSHVENYNKILEIFKAHNVHFLDVDGPFVLGDYIFIGHSGWYTKFNPDTNDKNFIPQHIEGNTNMYLYNEANKTIDKQMQIIDNIYVPEKSKVIFVSHFPVICTGDEWGFDNFAWSPTIGKIVQMTYDCKYFLNGHAHERHKGPLKYETGPNRDYKDLRYQIIEV